ncbi:MAG TPA: ribonuclease H [Polyangiaceae bacterium]|nr:ribonuclease H [Polyangiaceae bacterium]
MPSFVCQVCHREFQISEGTLAKFPGWRPQRCLNCKNQTAGGGRPAAKTAPLAARSGAPAATRPAASSRRAISRFVSREENLSVAEVLAKYSDGPLDGVFTDGAAEPNPGPGGWGVVYVRANSVVDERCGHEPHTTNNRMELRALLHGCSLVEPGTPTVIYTDSQLCVNTISKWAQGWEARGWKRKGGEIKNLDLIQELYAALQRRPELELRWIAAHAGNRWNEYADSLATAYRRKIR